MSLLFYLTTYTISTGSLYGYTLGTYDIKCFSRYLGQLITIIDGFNGDEWQGVEIILIVIKLNYIHADLYSLTTTTITIQDIERWVDASYKITVYHINDIIPI